MTANPTTAPYAGAVSEEPLRTPQMRRTLASSFLGNAIDFMLYASASALVFAHVFFASLDAATATLASFGTPAAGYVARPLGGITAPLMLVALRVIQASPPVANGAEPC